MTWERGIVAHEKHTHAFRCNNCNTVEYFTPRQAKVSDKQSPSQRRGVERIKRFYSERSHGETTFETKKTEYGDVWLYVSGESCWEDSASFTVSRHGKLTCYSSGSVGYDDTAHVAKMLGASTR